MNSHSPYALTARRSGPLTGTVQVPGDKSISHRSLILGALAAGETVIEGLLEAEDVLATAAALRTLGTAIERDGEGRWHVHGSGIGGLTAPSGPLDFGNSGTGARLMMGVVASHPITAVMTGDASLTRRPMGRVMAPLTQIGAAFEAQDGDRMPVTVTGSAHPMPICYRLPVPSAQVKSAILLAGLNTPGTTSVIETKPTRDHTERMLSGFGAEIRRETLDDGATRISLTGHPELAPQSLHVPADPSSAAFPMVAALITQGSEITIDGVMINPTRNGLIETLLDMGAGIELQNAREMSGETLADLKITSTPLTGVTVPAERAPAMIDEFPILAVAAATAKGTTRMQGLGELRVKESDRLSAISAGLTANGIDHEVDGNDLIVHGGRVPGGGTVETHLDHRIAMAFLVLGLASDRPVTVDDGTMIATSFPEFEALMRAAGADICAVQDGAP
ncbi:MAG: 3-phosphoshikimate 1-carboxyvinyltransferase [Geminicoccaceae bacterium]